MTNKKKIGIITILRVNNYGAELQAYALQKKLLDLGNDAEIIDYLFYKHREYIPTKASRPFVRLGIKRKMKEFLFPFISFIKRIGVGTIAKRREEKFESFHKNHTKLSRTYHSITELEADNHDYDVYMTGSDQVWNPYSNTSLLPYLLHFAPTDKILMSYASSFGVSQLPEDSKPYYAEYLKRFKNISVREESGIQIIKELTDKMACLVLDPTFLLTQKEWAEIAVYPDIKTPYILIYELSSIPYIKKLAEFISVQSGYRIVRICKDSRIVDQHNNILNVCDAGPQEFIGFFLKASFIITNSFHGTAFSINFQKPFYTVISSRKENNSRQESLLKMFELDDRLLSDFNPYFPKDYISCDFTETESLLRKWRRESVNYLSIIN